MPGEPAAINRPAVVRESAAFSDPAALSRPAATRPPFAVSDPAALSRPAAPSQTTAASHNTTVSDPVVVSRSGMTSHPAMVSDPDGVSDPDVVMNPVSVNRPPAKSAVEQVSVVAQGTDTASAYLAPGNLTRLEPSQNGVEAVNPARARVSPFQNVQTQPINAPTLIEDPAQSRITPIADPEILAPRQDIAATAAHATAPIKPVAIKIGDPALRFEPADISPDDLPDAEPVAAANKPSRFFYSAAAELPNQMTAPNVGLAEARFQGVNAPFIDDVDAESRGEINALGTDAKSNLGSAQTLGTHPPARPEAQHVLRQIVEVLPRMADKAVEIRLSPEELGLVRLQLVQGEQGLTVHVHADRPETLDLLRRNIDQLARDLAQSGHQAEGFSFSGGGAQSGNRDKGGSAVTDQATPNDDSAETDLQTASDGVDIII